MTTKTLQWEQDPPTFSRGKCTYEGQCVLKTENAEIIASPIYPPHGKMNDSYQFIFRDKKSKKIESAVYNVKTGETSYQVREEGMEGIDYGVKPEKLLGYRDTVHVPGLPLVLKMGIMNLVESLEEKLSSSSFN